MEVDVHLPLISLPPFFSVQNMCTVIHNHRASNVNFSLPGSPCSGFPPPHGPSIFRQCTSLTHSPISTTYQSTHKLSKSLFSPFDNANRIHLGSSTIRGVILVVTRTSGEE
jgi:hypothetical protein